MLKCTGQFGLFKGTDYVWIVHILLWSKCGLTSGICSSEAGSDLLLPTIQLYVLCMGPLLCVQTSEKRCLNTFKILSFKETGKRWTSGVISKVVQQGSDSISVSKGVWTIRYVQAITDSDNTNFPKKEENVMVVNLLKVWLLTEWLEHHQGNETAHCRASQSEGRAESQLLS